MMAITRINRANCTHRKDLWGVEVFKASYSTHAFSRHWHEGFGIGVVESGCEVFNYQGEKQYAPSRSIILMNPGIVHTGQAADPEIGWTYRMMYPDPSVMQNVVKQVTGKITGMPYFVNPVVVDARSATCLLRLFLLLDESSSALEYQSEFLITMAGLLKRYAKFTYKERAWLRDNKVADLIREYINQHYNQNISLSEISEISGRSQFHSLRVFQKKFGLPPHAYQISIRIQKAKNLLLSGRQISSVALEVGFADQSHLTRHFKRIVGVTPHKYVLI